MLHFLSPDRLAPFLKDSFGTKKFKLEPLRGGLLNQNSLLTVGTKRYVLKVYREEMDEAKVGEMHRLMKFASSHDVPVTLPIATAMIDGHVAATYPFATGEHPPRYRNNHARIQAMGETLGRIHSVLDRYQPNTKIPTHTELTKGWQPNRAVDEITILRNELKQQSLSVRKETSTVLDTYERILTNEDWNNDDFQQLPIRFCHGDYHIMNILMRGSTITAVLDWEKAGWNFRGREIMRSVIFNCRKTSQELNWPSVAIYLKAYRTHTSISDLDGQLAFECGLRNIVFSFWAIKQYLAGHKHFRSNIIRRVAMMEGLIKQRAEYAERIAEMLR